MDNINQLIIDCEKDMIALEKLYLQNKRKVFAFAYSILYDFDSAEDALQETFIRLPKAAIKFNSDKNGLTFILAITKNVSREIRRKRIKIKSSEELLDENISLYSDFTDEIAVHSCLDLLTDIQRQIVVLHIYHNLTFAEITEILKSPQSTIKSRYQKALSVLKSELGDDFYE